MDDLDLLLAEMEAAEQHDEEQQQTGDREDVAAAANSMEIDAADAAADNTSSSTSTLDTLLHEIRDLELQLKQASAVPSSSSAPASRSSSKTQSYQREKALFSLRKSLRSAYYRYICSDITAASQHDFEATMWKNTVYKQIEALRKLLKQCTPATVTDPAAATATAAASASTSSSKKYQHQLHRYSQFSTLTHRFLQSCSRMYEDLFFRHLNQAGWTAIAIAEEKNQELEGNNADAVMHQDDSSSIKLQLPSITLRPSSSTSALSSSPLRDLSLSSCHRCLVFRGDLERYQELIRQDDAALMSKRALIGNQDPSHHDNTAAAASTIASSSYQPNWSYVSRFYELALTLSPTLGNPYNQLAVLATYQNDTLLAVHRYMRALMCQTPFTTAEINLKLLFENTIDETVYKAHAQKHAAAAAASTSATASPFSALQTIPLFPHHPVCTHFMLTPWLDFGWIHLFHLLSYSSSASASSSFHHEHPQLQSSLPCVANAVLRRFQQQMRTGATIHAEFALRLLINFLYCVQKSHTAASTAMDDSMPPNNAAAASFDSHSSASHPPLRASTSALFICVEFLTLLMSTLTSGTSASIGVISTFLLYLKLHPEQQQLVFHEGTQMMKVKQGFCRALVELANLAELHLQTVGSTTASTTASADLPLLHEEQEILGMAIFSSPNMLPTNRQVDSRPDVRRWSRFLTLVDSLVNVSLGVVRDSYGLYCSLLDETSIIAASAKPATMVVTPHQPLPMPPSSPMDATPTPPTPTSRPAIAARVSLHPTAAAVPSSTPLRVAPQLAPSNPHALTTAEQVGAQLAQAFARVYGSVMLVPPSTSGSSRVVLPSPINSSSILYSNHKPPGLAPVPKNAPITQRAN